MRGTEISSRGSYARGQSKILQEGAITMATPYNLAVNHDCTKCSHRTDRPFCNLEEKPVAALDAMKFTTVHAKGALLFVEGEDPRSVYVLCSGRVKLTMSSSDGRTLIVRIAEAGEVLGATATVLGKQYEMSAETIEPCQVNVIKKERFLEFLRQFPEASMRLSHQLSENCAAAHRDIRALGLSQTANEKMARLLLDWCENGGVQVQNGIRLKVLLTHEEIAQMIGATRETVTRVISDFKSRKLIEVKGSTMIVGNPPALQGMVTI
jgi:CRP/FNR family transcriptional regulator, cyclic AMP receptor protein